MYVNIYIELIFYFLYASLTMLSRDSGQHSLGGHQSHGGQHFLGGHQSQSYHHDQHHFGKLYKKNYVKTNLYM